MPAYDVTVTATFVQTGMTDEQAVAAAKDAIETATYTVAQAVANTEPDVKAWLVDLINNLIPSATEITIDDSNISFTPDFTEATECDNGAFAFTVSLSKGAVQDYANGTGTITKTLSPDGTPICKWQDFDKIRNNLSGKFYLVNDIDMTDAGDWVPIGKDATNGNIATNFTGTLDGKGHSIKNMTITGSSPAPYNYDFSGLFARTGATSAGGTRAEIRNLNLVNVNINGGATSGGLIGVMAGSNNGALVENVSVTGIIKGTSEIGGITGRVANAQGQTINNCYVNAAVEATVNYAGGIVGTINGQNVTVTNSYMAGSVKSPAYAGGILGQITNANAQTFVLTNSVVLANSISGTNARVFCNKKETGSAIDIADLTSDYARNDIGLTATGATDGKEATLTDLATLKTQDFYKNTLSWDFINVWQIQEGKFPIFLWQTYPLDFVIEADGSKTASEYTSGDYGDIIIKSDDSSTGQFDLQGKDLLVNGVVKFQKAFTAKLWYPVGFPFDVPSVNTTYLGGDYTLKTYNHDDAGTDNGDFWLKTYNGGSNIFEFYNNSVGSESIVAGGYVLQVPADLDKLPITFTSESGIKLTSSTTCTSLPGGYLLTSNPSYMNNDVTSAYPDGIIYYTFGTGGAANFGLNHSTYTLKPFESVVVENGSTDPLRSSLGIDAVTALPSLNLPNDKVIATEYYNLMGVKVAQPARGNIYVIKTIFESGKTSVVKQFIENN